MQIPKLQTNTNVDIIFLSRRKRMGNSNLIQRTKLSDRMIDPMFIYLFSCRSMDLIFMRREGISTRETEKRSRFQF